MMAFYNEPDSYAAEWLRNLIAAGHIAPGVVDERDIRDIRPDELVGFRQCHFFAGIGVWSRALRTAGWTDDREIWTGSCPCQPFSAAGRKGGTADDRHLWPHFFWLISQCRPSVVLGEQVASKDGLGWLDLVSADMEGASYAFGASDLCAAGFGGAHIRQRLYFVGLANANGGNAGAERQQSGGQHRQQSQDGGDVGGLADSANAGLEGVAERGAARSDRQGRAAERDGDPGGLGYTEQLVAERDTGTGACTKGGAVLRTERHDVGSLGATRGSGAPMLGREAADWLLCRDAKWRPVEPGTFPLADAAPARVGRLRAYGNALDAETASQFVGAVMEAV